MVKLSSWLGLDRPDDTPSNAPLRNLLTTLDRMDPDRAQYLARFAYLLGRVAYADRHVTPEETAAMEGLLQEEGKFDVEQSMVVVALAKSSNLLFGGTADYIVAREFAESADYDEKMALARCLFAVAATDESISLAEETEIHRITNQLRIQTADLTRLRIENKPFLPGIRKRG